MGSKRETCEIDFGFVLSVVPVGLPAGGALTIFYLADRLANDGFEVSVIFLTNSKRYLKNLSQQSNIPRSKFDYLQNTPWITYYIIAPMFRKIKGIKYSAKKLKHKQIAFCKIGKESSYNWKFENLVATSYEAAYFVNNYPSQRVAKKFFIVNQSEDNIDFNPFFYEQAREAYKMPLQKIVYNQYLQERFRENEVYKFQYGYDNDRFRITNDIRKRPNSKIIIPLRNGKDKGADLALAAASLVHSRVPEAKFFAFGNYSGIIPEYIDFYFLPTKELNNLYNECSIFVLPSSVEGFSLPTIEAMACGNAVVVMDNEGVREFIRSGQNGILITERNAQKLAEAIIELIQNDQKRYSLAENGLATSRKFTRERMYSSFKKLFADE